jgi:hypothetical protein
MALGTPQNKEMALDLHTVRSSIPPWALFGATEKITCLVFGHICWLPCGFYFALLWFVSPAQKKCERE